MQLEVFARFRDLEVLGEFVAANDRIRLACPITVWNVLDRFAHEHDRLVIG
jgi:hypothetical protein